MPSFSMNYFSEFFDSAVSMNPSYLKSFQGILKIIQIVLGVTSFSLTCHYTRHVVQAGSLHVLDSTLFFVQLITFAFFFVTFLQAVAALVNSATADSFKTSLFEFLYNLVAAIFYLAGSIAVLSKWGALHRSYIQSQRTAAYKIWDETVMEPINAMIAASSFGLLNSILYFISAGCTFYTIVKNNS